MTANPMKIEWECDRCATVEIDWADDPTRPALPHLDCGGTWHDFPPPMDGEPESDFPTLFQEA